MAIYFPNSDSLLLLTPKTGTVWMREALKRSGVYHIPLGPPELRFHGYLSLFGRDFSSIAAFVRNPVDWHRSYWAYRSGPNSSWDPRWNIDADCASQVFEEYVERVTTLYPGFATRLYEKFTGPVNRAIDYVGRQERLTEHLLELLTLWGERFSEVGIREVAPLNVTERVIFVGDDVRRKIYASEKAAFERYGYDTPAAGAT
jgi:hypothetical protein